MKCRYRVIATYNGFSQKKDRKIEKVASRNVSGSGFGMEGRDISFCFGSKKAADKAETKLRRLKGVRVSAFEQD